MGRCPFANCDVSKTTCRHLDKFLNYQPDGLGPKTRLFFTDFLDQYEAPEADGDPTAGSWALFKRLRTCGLARDQISILLRKFVLDMPVRQIKEEMGWTSTATYYARYRSALETLKRRGFKR